MNLVEKTRLVGQQATKDSKCCGGNQFLLWIFALFLSPAVVAYYGGFDQTFLINLILWICGILPGAFHAWYVILGGSLCRRMIWTVVAIFLPPFVVGHKTGIDNEFWVNVVLTICGWVPGVLHAWYVTWTYSANRTKLC